jgi:hypothetical protein
MVKFDSTKTLFPIEVSLKSDAFEYQSNKTFSADGQEEEEVAKAEEAKENKEPIKKEETATNQDLFDLIMTPNPATINGHSKETTSSTSASSNLDLLTAPSNNSLLPDLQSLNINNQASSTAQDFLTELGLDEIDLAIGKMATNENASNSIDDLLN